MVGGPHPSSPLSFMMPNIDAFPQPPPAHMGIHIDPKTGTMVTGWMDGFDLSKYIKACIKVVKLFLLLFH